MSETKADDVPRLAAKWLYFLMIFAGIGLYLVWGVLYNSWNILTVENSGIYALTVLLVGFGIVGYLLYSKPQEE